MRLKTGYRRTRETYLEYKREYYRKWRKENKEKAIKATAEWRKRNPEKSREISNSWKKNNPDMHSHINAKRRAAQLQRTVTWADENKMKMFYEKSIQLSIETGIPHQVDHVIPLQGETVSGLHVHNNLQVLPAVDNLIKGNRFDGYQSDISRTG